MDGKRVFVTGGAKGIGESIVSAFCKIGARVAFCDTDEKAAERLCDLMPSYVQFFKADVSDEKALQEVINRLINMWGDVDVIVNNFLHWWRRVLNSSIRYCQQTCGRCL